MAITKCDLGDAGRVEAEVRDRLRGFSLGSAPIVPTSVRAGSGLAELREALRQEAEAAPAPRDVGKPRLFVDRAFTMRGAGTVVTGTLTGGSLRRGENVVLQPQNRTARVRALQSHNHALEVGEPATRVALNLPDVRLEEVPRGTLVTTLSKLEGVTLDAQLRRVARSGPRALKTGAVVQVHYGSARQTARVRLLDRRELAAGESAIARLTFAAPVPAFVGDRFVVRDSSGRATIAGGVVLDPEAGARRLRAVAQREFLQARAAAPNDLPTLLRTQLRRDGFARSESLLLRSNFSLEQVVDASRSEEFFHSEGIVADRAWWRDLTQRAAAAIDAAHAARPNESGLALTDLRTRLALEDDALFAALLADLVTNGFARVEGAIQRRSHQLSLPPHLQRTGAELRAALAAKPFDPPSRKELAKTAAAAEALRFLAQTGEVVLCGNEVVLGAAAFAKMKAQVTTALRARPATTSELRELLGTSRRVLIPFLEHLDKTGLTLREGDRRRLR